MDPIKLELVDEKGLIGTIDLPMDQFLAVLGSGNGSAADLEEELTRPVGQGA